MRVYSIGVIGTGMIAQQMHLPVLASVAQAKVAWVADVVAQRAKSVGRAYGVPHVVLADSPEQLPPCDVALLAVPLGVRDAYYPVLAKRGAAVFVEKPFAMTVKAHRRIVEQFESHRLACGLMRRTYANTLLLKAMIQEEWFGPLEAMRVAEGGRAMRTGADRTYMDDHRLAAGGVLLDLGCHTLDLALFITRAAGHEIVDQDVVYDGELDRKVTAAIQLRDVGDKSGAACRLDYCASWLDRQPNQIELTFAKASVVAGTTPDARVEIRQRGDSHPRANVHSIETAARTSYQAFYLEWEHFLRGLETATPSVVSAASCEGTTALIEGIYQRGAVSCQG